MINHKLLSVYVIIFLLFSATIAQSQRTNRSSISGFIFDSQRRPLSQVYVELLNDFNSVIRRVRTDGSGRYLFAGLSGGRFTVRALPLGTNLEEQSQDVEIVTFGGLGRETPENVQKDIYLRLRREGTGAAPVTGTIFVQEIPNDARKTYERAVSDIDSNKLEVGIAGLENAIKLFPNYYSALERLGTIYINQQKFEDARNIFGRAVLVNERSFNSWYGLSYSNYSLKQAEAAVEAAKKATSLNTNSVDAQLLLGISQRQAKQYKEAEKSLLGAKKLAKGENPNVFWQLALLYNYNLKRYKDAADALELYLKADPQIPNKDVIKKLIRQLREKQDSN